MDYSQAPLSIGILQARILECVAMPFSRGSSQSRDRTQVSHMAGGFYLRYCYCLCFRDEETEAQGLSNLTRLSWEFELVCHDLT